MPVSASSPRPLSPSMPVAQVAELPTTPVVVGARAGLHTHDMATRHAGDSRLEQEVAAMDVELRVLRAEVESKDREERMLSEQIRDVEMRLREASANVGTLSIKVETSANNRHAVLEASAHQIDQQVTALRRKLATTEWELAENDEEIMTLRQATQSFAKAIQQQNGELSILKRSKFEQEQHAILLAEDASRLQRQKTVGEWREHVQAKIEQEAADAAMERERRAQLQEVVDVEEENEACRIVISKAERCKKLRDEMGKHQRRYDELVMEERLCASAARLGWEAANEHRRSQTAECRSLENRLKHEASRRVAHEPTARTYDAHESHMARQQYQLAALTACMRAVSSALRHPAVAKDGNHLGNAWHHGGTCDTLARSRPRSQSPRSVLPVSAPPVVSQSPAVGSSHASRTWGVPALVAPIVIGGGDRLMTTM